MFSFRKGKNSLWVNLLIEKGKAATKLRDSLERKKERGRSAHCHTWGGSGQYNITAEENLVFKARDCDLRREGYQSKEKGPSGGMPQKTIQKKAKEAGIGRRIESLS